MRTLCTNAIVALVAGFTLGLFGCSGSGDGTPAPPPAPPPDSTAFDKRVAELDSTLAPLSESGAGLSDAELAPLAPLAAAQVVGLGEATHGTREFFTTKHRIFRYLVENHGFRVLAIEADMGESLYLDRHVAGAPGNLRQLMTSRMHFWTWATDEVAELIEWMREWNAGRPPSERLVYFGFDCQHVSYHPQLISGFIAAARPDLTDNVDALVAPFRTTVTGQEAFFAAMGVSELNDALVGLDTLDALFTEHATSLIDATSEHEFRMMQRLVVSLGQGARQVHARAHGQNADASVLRERCMADNVKWVQEGGVGVAAWAHNAHVMAGPWHPSGQHMMGTHLRNELGHQYKVVGFSFSRGDFTAVGPEGLGTYRITHPPRAGSLNELFRAARVPHFILDMSTLTAGSELTTWLGELRPKVLYGAAYDQASDFHYYQRYLQIYDVIIHHDVSTPTRLLQRP